MTEQNAVQGITGRPAEQRLIEYRIVLYRIVQVCRQKPPAVLTGGIFELGRMGGFIAATLRLPAKSNAAV
ncbi:hypothetical protein T4E_3333 [Trichinella pseudospiralis]|uniref:Uncharacterized protein n=1 Tax=Trichinella pseudospiralis TaxID=6337 RepID=A0A0V0XFA2_TRIPS|nr:hypothetical protein T4E_3333 [Trichinella pseudospiralis]